jgi:hypothetical protein
MTNWHETQSSTQVFDKLYHRLIGSLLEFQLVPPAVLGEAREGHDDFISRHRPPNCRE